MIDAVEHKPGPVVPAPERAVRRDVALAYRLVQHFGFADLTDGFVSARIAPGSRDVIIGGYGQLPELITASRLYRRSLDEPVTLQKKTGVDVDAIRFSQAVYDALPDMGALIHAHPFHAMLFSCLDTDILPMSQYGFMYRGKVGYVPFSEGDVTSALMRAAIQDAFATNPVVILRNHGVLVPGRDVAHAFWVLYRIEQACRLQVEAMKTGARLLMPDEAGLAEIQSRYWDEPYIDNDGTREWDELVRLIDRKDPSYRD